MAPNQVRMRSSRRLQPASRHGAGIQYLSPVKARDSRKKRLVVKCGRDIQRAAAQARLAELLGLQPGTPSVQIDNQNTDVGEEDAEMADWVDDAAEPSTPPSAVLIFKPPTNSGSARAKSAAHQWHQLLPHLEKPFAQYQEATYAKPPSSIPSSIRHECVASCTATISTSIQCLYISHLESVQVETCACVPVAALLVQHGVFPSSPTRPRAGVSIDLLEIYKALFERSCDAITALAAALRTVYRRRGFRITSLRKGRGSSIFRDSLSSAVLWYGNLRDRISASVASLLAATAAREEGLSAVTEAAAAQGVMEAAEATEAAALTEAMADVSDPNAGNRSAPRLTPGRADRILRERCPACFAHEEWGRPFDQGGDVQLGADGCFSYRHLRSAGDAPIYYDPTYFLSRTEVADAGRRVAEARIKGKRQRSKATPLLPQEIVDMCQESWDAANGKKRKADVKRYDASGVFVMTCRHSQVLFLCDIDTPGEQQHYIVALLEHTIGLLPPQATVLEAYDVACVTDHSLNIYPILKKGVRERISFVINAMHAFGHQWACQINYSPKFRLGIGLTDLEGVERFWSRIRKLIPATRSQGLSRRIWMLDQYAAFVSSEGLEGLGDWIQRQEATIPKRWSAAMRTLQLCGVSEAELRHQWTEQQKEQTSLRSHAPVRLRRDLDKVLALQTQIDAVEKAIFDVKQSIGTSSATTQSVQLLTSLQATHATLSTQAQHLYTSLNMRESFPQLQGLLLEFVRTLLIMRDLKINIRKRAVGSFYEWETLDRAVSGRREALGTKLHQATRKAISKRQPALLRAISKFNDLCSTLEEQRPQDCNIPIPAPLSTQLNGLRNDPTLHEDVWITPSEGEVPRWLDDDDVRDGIRSLHCGDRCAEEARRLRMERQNMRFWLEGELRVVSLAIESNTDFILNLPLNERRERLQNLQAIWEQGLRDPVQRPAAFYPPREATFTAGSAARASSVPASIGLVSASVASVASVPASVAASVTSVASSIMPVAASVASVATSATTLSLESNSDNEQSEDEDEDCEASDEDEVDLIEDVLGNTDLEDEPDESSGVDGNAVKFEIQWNIPANLVADTSLLEFMNKHNEQIARDVDHSCRFPRAVVGLGRRPTLNIEATDIDRLRSLTGQLNGTVLNGTAAALLGLFGHSQAPTVAAANRCALLSTYDLHRVQFKAPDDYLWGRLEPTAYWEKDTWLIPIHRRNQRHWVFVAVAVHQQHLYFFDSLGEREGWRTDLRDVMVLITRMLVLASRHGHRIEVSTPCEEPWIAQPIYQVGQPLQSNTYDCGVWVLAMVASFLRGYSVPAVSEAHIPLLRRLLGDYILCLPFT